LIKVAITIQISFNQLQLVFGNSNLCK